MNTEAIVMDDGCRIAYRLEGKSDAPVLVLSNSLGTAMTMWDVQMPLFANSYRVLRYDSRGHGASDTPVGAYSIDRLGRDVLTLLDALDMGTVHFCGLSLGGMVGQWLGYRAPERLRRLVLANTSAYMGPPAGWQTRIATVLANGMEPIVSSSLQRWFTPEFVNNNEDQVTAIANQLRRTSPSGYSACCAAIRDMDQRATSRLISVPTLIIAGARDPASPLAHSEFLSFRLGQTQLKVLEAAHLSNVERPDEFGQLVRSFLE